MEFLSASPADTRLKRSKRESDSSHSSSAEVKNKRSYTSAPQHVTANGLISTIDRFKQHTHELLAYAFNFE
jgi:hypothetical protein